MQGVFIFKCQVYLRVLQAITAIRMGNYKSAFQTDAGLKAFLRIESDLSFL
jgi:hypothetical protein